MIDTKELSLIKKEVLSVQQNTNSYTVTSSKDAEKGADLLNMIKNTVEIITSAKEAKTRPLMTELSQIRDVFKPLETTLDDAKKNIKAKILAWQIEEEDRIEKEKAKIEARTLKGTLKPETAIAKMEALGDSPTSVQGSYGKTSTRSVTKVRIVDEFAIPREYLIPDMAKITEAILRQKVSIPGVESYQEKVLVSR